MIKEKKVMGDLYIGIDTWEWTIGICRYPNAIAIQFFCFYIIWEWYNDKV